MCVVIRVSCNDFVCSICSAIYECCGHSRFRGSDYVGWNLFAMIVMEFELERVMNMCPEFPEVLIILSTHLFVV